MILAIPSNFNNDLPHDRIGDYCPGCGMPKANYEHIVECLKKHASTRSRATTN